MKRLKLLVEYIKLKHKGYTKENRMLVYAMEQYITFEEYEKYFYNKVMKRRNKMEDLDFGKVIQLLKEGKRLQRKGWNGKNQYIELATNISYKNAEGETINADHKSIGNKAIAFVGTSGVQLGWLASQADMLAEDWKIAE